MKYTTLFILLIFCVLFCTSSIKALKCRTEDGPTNEEIKKVVRTCMKKLDKNFRSDKNYDEYENVSSEETNNDRTYNQNSRSSTGSRGNNRNSYIGANPRYRRTAYAQTRYGNQGYDNNGYGGGEQNSRYGTQYGTSYGNAQRAQEGHSNKDRNQTNPEDISEHDRSCIIQCFLQEMKMTNSDGFPDKHKTNQILTKEIRDRQLKDFFTDTIQECFHVLDLDKKREKCDYSRNLVNCFTERGKMNCDDWQEDSNGLF